MIAGSSGKRLGSMRRARLTPTAIASNLTLGVEVAFFVFAKP